MDGGFEGDVVDHAVHSTHLADDGVGDFGQEFMWKRRPRGCHAVGGVDRTQSDHVFICALVAHHAHAPYRGQNRTCLPYLVVKIPVAQALDVDVVGFLKYAHFLRRHFPEYAHPEARAREGWRPISLGGMPSSRPTRRTSSLKGVAEAQQA